jgi:hypothetical protein
VDDVRLTDSELYDQMKAAVERFNAANAKMTACEDEFEDVYPEACQEYASLETDAGDALIALYAKNRDRLRFMLWSDAEHEPPSDPVCFASHTPEPTANKAEVFRFQLPYLSNIWRDVPTLARWVSEELIRNDLPGLVLVSGSNGAGYVTVEAFYNVNLIQSAGVYFAADNKGSN